MCSLNDHLSLNDCLPAVLENERHRPVRIHSDMIHGGVPSLRSVHQSPDIVYQGIPVLQQSAEGGAAGVFYLLFRQMRCPAFVFTMKLGVALPDDPSVRIVGVPYLGAVDPAAVPAGDLSRKAAGAELPPAGSLVFPFPFAFPGLFLCKTKKKYDILMRR